MKEKYLRKLSDGSQQTTFSYLIAAKRNMVVTAFFVVDKQGGLMLFVYRLSTDLFDLKVGSAWLVLNKNERIEMQNNTRVFNYDTHSTINDSEPLDGSEYEEIMGCDLSYVSKDLYQVEYNVYSFLNVDAKTMLKKISEASSVDFFVSGSQLQYSRSDNSFRTYARACYSCFYENIYPDELHHFTKFKFNKWMFYIPLLVFFSAYGVYKGGVGGFILLTCVAAFAICVLELARMVLKLVWMVIRGIF